MKNKEKYAKEILDIVCDNGKVAMLDGEIRECRDVDCELCDFHVAGVHCRCLFTIWANNEYVDEHPVNWSKVKVDTPIWVRHTKKNLWVPRYFAKYENGMVYAWDACATSWSAESSNCVCDWEYAQIAEREDKMIECMGNMARKPQNDARWIPVKYHVITEEEREEGCFSEDIVYYLDCKIPDDDQEIIVTDGKYVWSDTCIVDDGFALDSGHDWIEDVIAWMPMPEPYKESEDV